MYALRQLRLGGGLQRLRARKVVAAGQPLAWFTFAKYQGVKRRSVRRLDTHGRAAPLVQVGQLHPRFQRLFAQFASEFRAGVSRLSIEHQPLAGGLGRAL